MSNNNTPPDWSNFTVQLPIPIAVNKIREAWATQAMLETWFLRLAEFTNAQRKLRQPNDHIQIGDTYKWCWHGWPDDVAEHGIILPPKTNELIRFTFGKAGVVSVKVDQQNGETILQLHQENIPQDEFAKMNFHVGCKTGWTFYLLNLKSILMGELDLRNKNKSLQLD